MLKPPTQTHGRTVLGKCEEPIKSGLMASVCRSLGGCLDFMFS